MQCGQGNKNIEVIDRARLGKVGQDDQSKEEQCYAVFWNKFYDSHKIISVTASKANVYLTPLWWPLNTIIIFLNHVIIIIIILIFVCFDFPR